MVLPSLIWQCAEDTNIMSQSCHVGPNPVKPSLGIVKVAIAALMFQTPTARVNVFTVDEVFSDRAV